MFNENVPSRQEKVIDMHESMTNAGKRLVHVNTTSPIILTLTNKEVSSHHFKCGNGSSKK